MEKQNKSIMIVEDEQITVIYLRHVFSDLGYSILGDAATGAQAIQIYESKKPEIILMDIVLKGDIDGIETSRKILEIGSPKIIFISSNSDPATRERASCLGEFPYFVKPLDIEKIHQSIQSLD
jgi:CheY-like chemotaxis protein